MLLYISQKFDKKVSLAANVVEQVTEAAGQDNVKITMTAKKANGDIAYHKLNMTNIKSIKYTTSKKAVTTVNKKGKITAKKKGTATIKAKVTLLNGRVKTVKIKVKVK